MTDAPSADATPTGLRFPALRWGLIIVLVPLAIFGIMKGCNLLSDIEKMWTECSAGRRS